MFMFIFYEKGLANAVPFLCNSEAEGASFLYRLLEVEITSFKMSPSSLGGGKQTTTAGEHISQLVETLIGRFFF